MSNQQLTAELRKPIIRKFEKQKVYSYFKDNIWGADLVNMQVISKYNKGFHLLLYVINTCSKYAWVIHVNDKKTVLQLLMLLKRFWISLGANQTKLWVCKRGEFYKI